MIALALAAASTPNSAIDAERAFARDAKRMGQWSAFRKWADRDAVMFTPQAVWARTFLEPLKNPPRSISWRPSVSYISCDRRTAVNSGPWFTQDGKLAGYFTTIWQRTRTRWRWVYDGGGPPTGPAPTRKPRVLQAACSGHAPGPPIKAPPLLTPSEARTTPDDSGRGESADGTLGWDWKVEKSGARRLHVYQWDGHRYAIVLHNQVPAPKRR